MKDIFYSDVQILDGLSTGNKDAINIIYKQYYPIFKKWLLTRGGEATDADDIFQDGLMILYQKSKDVEFCLTCSISTYLFSICKRLWLKKIQNSKAKPVMHLDFSDNEEAQYSNTSNDEMDLQNFLENEEKYQKLNTALAQIGDNCAQLIKAFYIDKKSMSDIATIFNYTNTENAKVQKYKCLTRLRKLFFKD